MVAAVGSTHVPLVMPIGITHAAARPMVPAMHGVVSLHAAGMAVFGFVGASHFVAVDEGTHLTGAGAELLFDDMARLPGLVAARAAAQDAG